MQLRPSPANVDRVSAVPYDVVNAEEARAMAAGNPLSFLHVSRAEIDLPPATDPYSDAVYNKALENFTTLRTSAPLVVEDEPAVYFYRLKNGHALSDGPGRLLLGGRVRQPGASRSTRRPGATRKTTGRGTSARCARRPGRSS